MVWVLILTKFCSTNTQQGKTKEQKIVNVMKRKVGIIDRTYQLYIDFPCSVQFITQNSTAKPMSTQQIFNSAIQNTELYRLSIISKIVFFYFFTEKNCFDCKLSILKLKMQSHLICNKIMNTNMPNYIFYVKNVSDLYCYSF